MKDVTPGISGEEMPDESTPSEYSLPTVVSPLSGSPRYARPQSAAVSRETEKIIQEGEAKVLRERGRLRTEKPVFQTKVRKNDAVVLVEYFLAEWENLLVKKPLLANSKPIDRKGECQGYIWHQFLRPEYGPTYTGNQVMEMIDAFFLDLASGRVGLKQRQSAWKAFTVHWQPPKTKTTYPEGKPQCPKQALTVHCPTRSWSRWNAGGRTCTPTRPRICTCPVACGSPVPAGAAPRTWPSGRCAVPRTMLVGLALRRGCNRMDSTVRCSTPVDGP